MIKIHSDDMGEVEQRLPAPLPGLGNRLALCRSFAPLPRVRRRLRSCGGVGAVEVVTRS